MALTYRTPMEDIVASFEPAMQNAIASTAANGYKALEEKNFHIANYKLDNKSKEKLSNAGIYLSPFSAVVHSHPVCKTLENYFLYTVLPNYINNKFLFIGIKDSKLSMLKARDPKLSLIESINRYVTSADAARYSQEFTAFHSKPYEGLKRHKMSLEGATLRDLVPAAMAKGGKHFFLHDELHYWGKRDLMTFLEVFDPTMVLATAVIPPELLIGATQSLNPWCYKFEIIGRKLLFFPDGERTEGYEQPLTGKYLLKTNEIHLINGNIYCVDIVCSKFAHHLICISKGQRATNKFRCFGNFEAVGFEKLKCLSSLRQTYFPVSFNVTSKILRYLMSLKKPDLQSAIAKLSQIVADPDCNEIKFVTEFSQLVINCGGVNSLLNPDRLKIFFSKFYKKSLPNWLSTKIKSVREVSLDEFISDLAPLSITVELERLERGFLEEVFEADGFEAESYIDVPELIQERFSMGSRSNEVHKGRPYIGIEKEQREPEPLFIFDFELLVHRLAIMFRNSFLNAESRFINRRELEHFLNRINSSNPFFVSPLSLEVQGITKEKLMERIIRRIKALMTNCMRPIFNELSEKWFLMRRRLNSKYLCNYPDGSGAMASFKKGWTSILQEIKEIGGPLKKFQSSWEEVKEEDKKEVPSFKKEESKFTQKVDSEVCCNQLTSFNYPTLTNGFALIANRLEEGVIAIMSKDKREDRTFGGNFVNLKEWPEWVSLWIELIGLPKECNVVLIQRTKSDFTGLKVEEVSEPNWGERYILNIVGESQLVTSCSRQFHMVPVPDGGGVKVKQSEEERTKHAILADQVSEIKITISLILDKDLSDSKNKEDEGKSRIEGEESNSSMDGSEISRAVNCSGVSTFSLNECNQVVMDFPDKLKGRNAAFYSRDGDGYQYAGGKHKSLGWGKWLDDILKQCKVEPLAFNHCLAQMYSEGGKIGFHADDESCYPIDNCILTVNVCGACRFGIKSNAGGGADYFLLNGPQLLIMPFGFQKTHKHSVGECSEGRTSLTFRSTSRNQKQFFLDEKAPLTVTGLDDCSDFIELQIEENAERIEMNERGRFDSVLNYLSNTFELNSEELNAMMGRIENAKIDFVSSLVETIKNSFGMDFFNVLIKFMSIRRTNFLILVPELGVNLNLIRKSGAKEDAYLELDLKNKELVRVFPKNICVLAAISECWGRKLEEVFQVVKREENGPIYESIIRGDGVQMANLEIIFKLFSIKAMVYSGKDAFLLNEGGTICGSFELEGSHLNYVKNKKDPCTQLLKKINIDKQFSKLVMNKVKEIASPICVKVNQKRATILANCLNSGSTGVILTELFNSERNLKEVMRNADGSEEVLQCVLGTFGCGKSRLFKQFIGEGLGKKFDIVSPRKALLEEIKKDIGFLDTCSERKKRGQGNWRLSTFETFLKRAQFLSEGQVVFVDEIQLYPPGYVDLILCLAPRGVNWIIFGDPCQSDYHNEKDDFILGQLPSNVECILSGQSYKFNILSRRFLNRTFLGRLPCEFDESSMKFCEPYLFRDGLEALSELEPKYKEAILVSSFEEKRIVEAYCTGAKRILTFGESTGLTFNWGTILITLISERTNEKRWLTALSRFRRNICFINSTGYSLNNLLIGYKEKFLGKFLTGSALKENVLSYLEGDVKFTLGFEGNKGVEGDSNSPRSSNSDGEVPIDLNMSIGKDEGVREEKLVGDPWLKSMVDLFQIEDCQEVEMQKVEEAVTEFKVHLPREELESTRARWVHRILAKEFREHRIGSLVSTQFADEHSKQAGAIKLTNAAERFECIYPRHRSNDTVTFLMAVKKRLRFSKPHIEKGKLLAAKPYGKFMLQQFLKKVPLKRCRDHMLFEKARQDFFDKKTSKSAATIENHNIRSCRDWLIDMTQIFSKSQLCTKFDNRFRSAKAAQTIVCFQHSVLCRFAPYMRYIEMKLKESLPKKYYIHSGKGLEELNDWVIKNKFDGTCTESDYEAFDASQDQYIVAFELELMKYLGIPNDLIADYEFIKLHLGSKLGSFAIMRFTGEASTFLFNTMANMLFTFLRYDIRGNESICFAGDDMCSSKRLTVKKEFEGFLSLIKLKAKVQHTKNPTFCGWHLCPDGIYKKPQLVFERMCIARETNNLHNCIDNYAIEVSFAYKKGEAIMARMDEEEIGAYYGCVRTIIKHKHLLKSDVKHIFEGATV